MMDLSRATVLVDNFLSKVRKPLIEAVASGKVSIEDLDAKKFSLRKDHRTDLEDLGDQIAKMVNDGQVEDGGPDAIGDEIARLADEV